MSFRPVSSLRYPSRSRFLELFLAPGPNQIGETGDNSYQTLFGRDWLLVWSREDLRLHLYQEALDGSWIEVTTELPPIFDSPVAAGNRRFSFAFDQSARIILCYEDSTGTTRVTRWDPPTNGYLQNVTFTGVDPSVWMDATVADPSQILSGGEREAAMAGLGVAFEWLASDPPQWMTSSVPDSDVILFYLSADRLTLSARVQRQLYATEHEIFVSDEPLILDRAVSAAGRYQLLISSADGEPRDDVLVSDPYIGDVMLAYSPSDSLSAGVQPENLRAESDTYNATDDDALDASVAPENLVVVGNVYPTTDDDALDAGVQPENLVVVGNVYPTTDDDALDAGVQPEDIEARVMDIPASDEDAITGGITVENIRVQTV